MIGAAEMASMQALQAQTMVTACYIGRRSYAADGLGGQTETITSAAAVCRVAASANAPDYQIAGARIGEAQLWRLTFPAETDVRKTDRITVGARVFEVLGILAPSTYETARVTVCSEV